MDPTAISLAATKTGPASLKVKTEKERLSGIDSVKVLAIFAVVCIHTPWPGDVAPLYWQIMNQLARWAVPFFFITAGYFFTNSCLRKDSVGGVLADYSKRIGLAFFTWALFYLLVPPLYAADGLSYSQGLRLHLQTVPHPSFLLWGGTFHLWFLSSLVQGIAIQAFFTWIKRPNWALYAGVILLGAGLLMGSYSVLASWLPHKDTIRGPFFSTLPIAIGSFLARGNVRTSIRTAIGIGLAGMLLHFAEIGFLNARYGSPLIGHSYVVGTIPWGIGIALLAFNLPNFGVGIGLNQLGKCSLGLYAFHIYVLNLLNQIPMVAHSAPIFHALVVFAITSAAVILGARIRLLQFIFR